jgi:hypothetical protein
MTLYDRCISRCRFCIADQNAGWTLVPTKDNPDRQALDCQKLTTLTGHPSFPTIGSEYRRTW